MESDSEAAESELGEAVSVQGNLKFGKKGNKDDEIYYNFYPCLPNRASFPSICDFVCKALTSSGNSPNENSLCRNAAKFHFIPNTKEEKSSYVTSTVLLQVDLGGKLDFIFFSGSIVLKLNMQ